MTNCCDAWGNCDQSDTCPARTGVVLPHQAAHARRVACGQQVARVGARRPKWLDGKGTPVPPEAGNFKIVDLGPADDDGQPLDFDESMALVHTLMVYGVAVVLVVLLLAVLAGYATERWADVLLAFFRGLS
jgi:hypothetical protein